MLPFTAILLFLSVSLFAQDTDQLINIKEVERIERKLASDDMQGRKAGTAASEQAADFIAGEFKKAGLQPMPGASGFRQPFVMVEPELVSLSVHAGEQPIENNDVIIFSPRESIEIIEGSGYEQVYIKAGSSLRNAAMGYLGDKTSRIVIVDSSFRRVFPRLAGMRGPLFLDAPTVIFILAGANSPAYEIKATQKLNQLHLSNITGMIPGKTRKNEYVIFSAHYDHLGTGDAVEGDSIFNGANDDAAGTTAVIMLAKYFKAVSQNERTLIFTAFTAEEAGGFGSQYFSKQLPAEKVVAMFNIEMIGTESKWGKQSAFITGYEQTNMGKILEANLSGSAFRFYPDPYPEQELFYRSDNATLARLGVPAHTISTSKMDNEPYYHTVNDEVETLDLENMVQIIRAIAWSSKTIISGKDTPTRVKPESLTR